MKKNLTFILFISAVFCSCNDIVRPAPFNIQTPDMVTLTSSDSSKYDNYTLKELLQELSKKAIILHDSDFDTLTENWIGYAPATEAEIAKTEDRLNVKLPEDYKSFLRITNGFLAVNGVEPSFFPVQQIDYLAKLDPLTLSLWGSESIYESPNGYKYDIAIAIGGIHEDQQFFLIPPPHEYAEWEYWKFAHWIPGEEINANLFEYFKEVTEFCEELIHEEDTHLQFSHSP